VRFSASDGGEPNVLSSGGSIGGWGQR